MFNFSKWILITIGILILVYSLLIIFISKYTINKTILEKELSYEIPNLIANMNTTPLLEQDYTTLEKNLAILKNSANELNFAYVCFLDMEKNPISYIISEAFDDRSKIVITKKIENAKEMIKVKNQYTIFNDTIKEFTFTVGNPAVGIIKIGYFWDKVQSKANVIQFALLSVTVIALILMIIITIFLDNKFKKDVSDYIFSEKKKAIEVTRQHTIKEIDIKQQEKLKKTLETDLTQSEMFIVFELMKESVILNNFNETMAVLSKWLLKLFNSKNVMFYLLDANKQYLYGVYGIEGTSIIEGNDAYDQHIIIGEGELGLAVHHKNLIIGDIPRQGYSLSSSLMSTSDLLIGGVVVSNKNDNLKFDAHDKLLGRVVFPIVSNMIFRFMQTV
ncbi:hypothetical protein KA977_04460 [Candidatus Dependentiae bacterium]|nr:hypothetical protein [Candidatus Dependentiae bacterium]